MAITNEEFAGALLADQLCSSLDEAIVVAECVLNDAGDDSENLDMMTSLLQDYIGIGEDQARKVIEQIYHNDTKSTEDDDESFESNGAISNEASVDENHEEDMPLFDGECELCDRYIKLTKHHLMPKSTWSRMESRLRQAAFAKEDGDMEKAILILGPGLVHVVESLNAEKSSIREIMALTCDICRPCHDAIHRTHDNVTLALSFNTIDQLLEDEKIAGFAKWASKQRTGKYSMHIKRR